MKNYNILIGTCSSLGSLLNVDLSETHFTHVIVDEAGQLTEPETMIPISLLSRNNGQLILAGDPQQLGPIVYSKYARDFGLNKPYLTRLLEQPPYLINDKNEFNENLISKLTYNYRAIPSILEVYNSRFYCNTLKSVISETKNSPEVKLLADLQPVLKEISPEFYNEQGADIGIYMFPVDGENAQSKNSPSWYNTTEANKLVLFYLRLIRSQIVNVSDIGIITPYVAQANIIRDKITNNMKESPKIGTVEEFQGQEKNVILLSTVRTCPDKLNFDKKYTLGFVKEPKRVNVAISRAKSLLVVFGCPKILMTDVHWRELTCYTVVKKTYQGDETNFKKYF